MKWKADYSRAHRWEEVFAGKLNKRWIKMEFNSKINSGTNSIFDDNLVYKIDFFKQLYLGDKLLNTIPYQDLIFSDWYPVSEVKEEPKKEEENQSDVVKEHIRRIKENEMKKENMIRAICREEIAKKEFNQEWLSTFVKDICQAEIKEENKTRYVFPNMKAQNQAYSLQVLDKLKEITKTAEKISKKFHKKKPKQEFDGELLIYISDSGNLLHSHKRNGGIPSDYRLATQSDINNFFKGTKNRKPKQYTYFKETKRALNNSKIDERFYKKEINSISSSIEITEKEYLEGLK